MAKKQTRRSISVSRTTYERLKAFCETNHISMSQLVETRVNDFLGPSDTMRPEMGVVSAMSAGSMTSMTGAGGTSGASAMGAMSAPRPMPMASMQHASSSSSFTHPAPRAPLPPSRPVEARPRSLRRRRLR
jgi:hypothetical protein